MCTHICIFLSFLFTVSYLFLSCSVCSKTTFSPLDARYSIDVLGDRKNINVHAHTCRYDVCIFVCPPTRTLGDSDQDSHVWVSGWYLAATEFNILNKAYSSQQKLVSC